jgi:uncharacterized protein
MWFKNLFKAIGFTLLMLFIYFTINIGLVTITGIGITIFNVVVRQTSDIGQIQTQVEALLIPLMLIGNLLTIGLVMLIFLARKDKFFQYVGFRRIKVIDGANILAFGAFFNILIIGLMDLAIMYLPIKGQLEEFESMMEPLLEAGLIPIVLAVSISAPLFEEILFRGIIFNDFKKAMPVWLAILTQGLLFGLFHGNWIQGVYATLVGIVLGFVYYKYKSIWAVILLHFSYNTISLLLDQWLHTNLNTTDILILGMFGTILFGVVMIRTYNKEDYCDTLAFCNLEKEVENVETIN